MNDQEKAEKKEEIHKSNVEKFKTVLGESDYEKFEANFTPKYHNGISLEIFLRNSPPTQWILTAFSWLRTNEGKSGMAYWEKISDKWRAYCKENKIR